MLKEVIKVAVLLAAGMMVYDINKAGGFVKSDVYKFLEENGVVEYGEMFVAQLKTFYNKAMKFSKDEHRQARRHDMCMDIHAFIDLFYNMLLVFKNSIASVFENSTRSFNKNFPNAVDDVSLLVSGAFTSTKDGLVLLSSHLQNFTFSAVNYANEAFRT